MAVVFSRKAIVIGVLAGVSCAVAALAACSSTTTGNNGGSPEGGGACTSNALEVVFAPMYSAYESAHTYQIPAIVNGLSDPSIVQWTVSDPTVASMAQDTDTGGIMLTMLKSGTVTVTAQAGGLCGQSTLTVSAATTDQWTAGNARYNSNVPFYPGCVGLGHRVPEGGCPDAGPACTNCHGPTATSTGFNDIAHTPEQTGGFSDQDLIGIIQGNVPDGGYFDPNILPYSAWQQFHHWDDIQGTDQQAMVVYLRSLTPTSQNGSANFGGRQGDGGRPPHDGGFGHDGGGGGNDSGSSGDTGSTGDATSD